MFGPPPTLGRCLCDFELILGQTCGWIGANFAYRSPKRDIARLTLRGRHEAFFGKRAAFVRF